ncbi:hypothetical protein A3F06_02315 [candidate division TM6 bacterium RIFCSPHIGHO2_12_FULL_36_22]|nr:MAG: hypothetical protein A3F06_02315 [candidate division TM6 bacterium RIFCSPHIGHO2_12_FULL_36_22]
MRYKSIVNMLIVGYFCMGVLSAGTYEIQVWLEEIATEDFRLQKIIEFSKQNEPVARKLRTRKRSLSWKGCQKDLDLVREALLVTNVQPQSSCASHASEEYSVSSGISDETSQSNEYYYYYVEGQLRRRVNKEYFRKFAQLSQDDLEQLRRELLLQNVSGTQLNSEKLKQIRAGLRFLYECWSFLASNIRIFDPSI